MVICLFPLCVYAVTFDEMLAHKASNSQPFRDDIYKNITWASHTPDPEGEPETAEADSRGQIDIGKADLDGDGAEETIKVIWGPGVSDHSLNIELYKGDAKIGSLKAPGIQPNFKIEDIDADKKLEVIIWGAVADPNMSQYASDESKPFEAHSDLHLFKVEIYKLEKGKYILSKEYTSRKKYEPFCEEQPEE